MEKPGIKSIPGINPIPGLKTILVSRTDAIGDVLLSFPLCGLIKKHYPSVRLVFIGRAYTRPVAGCCIHIDDFLDADELLKLSKRDALIRLASFHADAIIHVFPNRELARLSKQISIKYRIGTTNRIIHWSTVNKLVRLSRKNSGLHESQLNCKLLEPLGIAEQLRLEELAAYTGFTRLPALPPAAENLLDPLKINVILHPKSNASAREWSLANYSALIQTLPSDQYKIFISGSENEKLLLSDWIKTLPSAVNDITGRFSLKDFIAFISKADCLVAASTGPLHIAAATGITAIGLFPNIRPMHPGRWQPIGKHAVSLCTGSSCTDCKKNPAGCHCINEITPEMLKAHLPSKTPAGTSQTETKH